MLCVNKLVNAQIIMSSVHLQIILLIIIIVIYADDTHLTVDNDDKALWESAKKELARRTRAYIKRNPISRELQEYIEMLRLGGSSNREKRQEHHDMYAIQNGEVVPLAQLEEHLRTGAQGSENFTIVPLIIPIPLENTVTLKEELPTKRDESDLDVSSERAVLGRGEALQAVKNKRLKPQAETNEAASGTEETVVDSLVEEKLKSTSESAELNKVLEDVENLISAQKKGKGSSKEGALCNVSGYWDSESGGMTFHIKKSEDKVDIAMKSMEPPSEDGFIPPDKWNVSVRIPFTQSAQVIITLTANKGRRVALFLGECRVCDGSETITGDWLVGRTSSNCKDQKASHSYVSDVFRKNNVESLREAHMKKISTVTTASSTSTEMT